MTAAVPERPPDELIARRLDRLFDATSAEHPDSPCLEFMGRSLTYGETGELVDRAASGLQARSVRKGARVGLCLPNCPYYVIAYFAALKAGATVVNFNPLYTTDEIRAQIEDCGVSIMFTLDMKSIHSKVIAAADGTRVDSVVVCSLTRAMPRVKALVFALVKHSEKADLKSDAKNLTFEELVDNDGDVAPVECAPATDIAVIQYTGGTTGTPKGVMLTHANLCANIEQIRLLLGEASPAGERMLCVIPFFHVFAMTVAMNLSIAIGAGMIMLPRFDLKRVLKTIHSRKPTLFPAVPTIYAAIGNYPRVNHFDLTSIRYCISGGAALPLEVKSRFESVTGSVLVEGYGLTEASPVVTCNPLHGENRAGSVGLPLPWTDVEIRDLDEPGRRVAAGERGELVVRGPQVMAGYLNRPGETADVLQDKWLRTGDVGHVDGDGYVYITDRIKDVINCSGFKVYPRVIEDVLYRHRDVAEAVVIGVPDEYRGETPKAFVTLRKGGSASVEELLEFASRSLNPIERPAALEIREDLPRSLIGKLSRKALVEESRKGEERGT